MQSNFSSRGMAIVLGGISFFATAILQIIALFGPPLAGDFEFLDLVIEQSGSTLFFTYTMLAVSLFNIPAILGITHLIKGRGEKLTYIGSVLALIGNFFFVVLVTEAIIQRGMATLDREQMTNLLQWMFDTPVYFVPHLLSILLFLIGMLLITIGLFRARTAKAWLIVAAAAQIIAGMVELGAIQEYVQGVIIFVLFGGLGSILLKMPKEQDETVTLKSAI